jgi:hypothetical protein
MVEVEKISYWHVELDSHDILVANNLPAESYIATGNRGFFEEALGGALFWRDVKSLGSSDQRDLGVFLAGLSSVASVSATASTRSRTTAGDWRGGRLAKPSSMPNSGRACPDRSGCS